MKLFFALIFSARSLVCVVLIRIPGNSARLEPWKSTHFAPWENSKKKYCILSSSRADFGILSNFIKKLFSKKNVNLEIDNKSRYIINYSNKIYIENERLMSLPSTLYNVIKKTYQIESLKKENKDKIYNYYIYGINQNLPNLNNIGMIYILSELLNKTIFETISLIKDIFIKNPILFRHVSLPT